MVIENKFKSSNEENLKEIINQLLAIIINHKN